MKKLAPKDVVSVVSLDGWKLVSTRCMYPWEARGIIDALFRLHEVYEAAGVEVITPSMRQCFRQWRDMTYEELVAEIQELAD